MLSSRAGSVHLALLSSWLHTLAWSPAAGASHLWRPSHLTCYPPLETFSLSSREMYCFFCFHHTSQHHSWFYSALCNDTWLFTCPYQVTSLQLPRTPLPFLFPWCRAPTVANHGMDEGGCIFESVLCTL